MIPSRHLLAACSIVALAAVTACGGSDDKAASDTKPSNGSSAPAAGATAGSSSTAGGTAAAPKPDKPRVVAAKYGPSAERWLADKYPEAAWVKKVKEVSVRDNTITATTKLGPKDATQINELCEALTMYSVLQVKGGFTAVSVKNSSGKAVITRKKLSQPCKVR